MELRNYYYVATDGHAIELGEELDYLVRGKIYGSKDHVDGELISTSRVFGHYRDYVVTEDNIRYELCNAHPDYLALIEVRKIGIPVITNWRFRVGYLTSELSEDKPGESLREMFDRVMKVKARNALMITGRGYDGEVIDGEIVAQDGNYVTLNVWKSNPDGIFGITSQEYFIDWFDPDPMFGSDLLFYPHRFGVRYDEEYKPRIDLSVYIEYRNLVMKEATKKTTD